MTPETPLRDATPADIESSSDAYARRFSGPVGAWFLDVQSRATLDLLATMPGGSALEVGGGHGQLTGVLVDAGFAVTVLGSSPICGERVRHWVASGQARFTVGELTRAPWPDRAFDVVLAFRLLPHVAPWRDFVRELCRLARRAVVIDYPTRRSVNALSAPLFGLKRRVESDTRPFTVFSEHEVAAAFEACGYRITGRRAQFLVPMALHRAVGSAGLSRAVEGGAAAAGLTSVLGSPLIVRAEPMAVPAPPSPSTGWVEPLRGE